VKALIHRRAQFEGDALWNIQPVQFIVEDVRQTTCVLTCVLSSFLNRVRSAMSLSVVGRAFHASEAE